MSKKKFTDGLESLFGVAHEDELQDGSPLLVETGESTDVAVKEKKRSRRRTNRNRSGKSFTTDLESLFTNAVRETIEEKTKEAKEQAERKAALSRRIRRKPVSGLDALIRQTLTSSRVEVESSNKKRVTFIFDKKKLVRLKTIARNEKAYLKDIIGEVVSEFIQRYEEENGITPDIQFKS